MLSMAGVELFSRSENPLDVSWEKWSEKWWNWIFSIPINQSPIDGSDNLIAKQDDPSILMAQNHPDRGDVVFLAGARRGMVNRTCSNMPANKGILFPVATCECSYAEFPNYTAQQIEQAAKNGNKVTDMEADIDGQTFGMKQLQSYYVDTKGEFDIQNIVKDNIFGAEEGPSKAYSVGYWLFLKPLETGTRFKMSFKQNTEDNISSKTFNCSYVVNYDITIV
jgi:hypothetical protein